MSAATQDGPVEYALRWDKPEDGRETVLISRDLQRVLRAAHAWTLKTGERPDKCTLSFSSALAALVLAENPLRGWLQDHLSRGGADLQAVYGGANELHSPVWSEPPFTTHSFRQAFAEARALRDAASADVPVDVRHILAAYAILPGYHVVDFLRLGIDRRALSLALSAELIRRHPDEKAAWQSFADRAPMVAMPGFSADTTAGEDLLDIEREVTAFSMLIASRQTSTPLSIGVFGAWGSGKSFFMRAVRDRVSELAEAMTGRERHGRPYHQAVAQIEFNAWHYAEANIIVSLVAQIFRSLASDKNAPEVELARRREVLQDLLREQEGSRGAQSQRLIELNAEASRLRTERAVNDAQLARLVESQQKAQTLWEQRKGDLDDALGRIQEEVEKAKKRAPAAASLALVGGELAKDERVAGLLSGVKDLRAQLDDLFSWNANTGRAMLLGLGLLVLTGAINYYLQLPKVEELLSILAGVGTGLATLAGYLRRGREVGEKLANKGEDFQAAVVEQEQRIEARVTARHAEDLKGLEQGANTAERELEGLREALSSLEAAVGERVQALSTLEARRGEIEVSLAHAEAEIASTQAALRSLSMDALLRELLAGLATDEGYQKELGVVSRVRRDLERLSELMLKSDEAFYRSPAAPLPAVSRIVLYIDDLDRCPSEVVSRVLQVVHLLLALPLFVVVVAVDPRWLARSLKGAPGVLEGAGLEELAQLGNEATSADYLEKIVQIPLWIRPIQPRRSAMMVRALLKAGRLGTGAAVPGQPEDSPVVLVSEPVGADAVLQTRQVGKIPPGIQISEVELDAVTRVADLLGGNPRALKRFANLYRLVKASLAEADLRKLEAATDRSYLLCMAQLALLTTQRRHALALVHASALATPEMSVGFWLRFIESDETAKGPYEAEWAELSSLLETALSAPVLEELQMSTFLSWLDRTRRYSFYV